MEDVLPEGVLLEDMLKRLLKSAKSVMSELLSSTYVYTTHNLLTVFSLPAVTTGCKLMWFYPFRVYFIFLKYHGVVISSVIRSCTYLMECYIILLV